MLELIVDRNQAHVDLLKQLRTKSWESMTAGEQVAWYGEAAKGAYNHTDLNRVESAVAELSEDLGLGLATKTDWTQWDCPCEADMTRYLGNIAAIREACPDKAFPVLPESMDKLTVESANNIEYSLRIAAGEANTDVEISMVDGTNVAGDSYFNATTKMGGTFADGKFITNGSGSLSVPIYYINGSECWTVAVTIDTFKPVSSIGYMIGSHPDGPCVSYQEIYDLFLFSLLGYGHMDDSDCEWYDTTFFVVRGSFRHLAFRLWDDRKNTLVFRNDGTRISFWVNGTMRATMLLSDDTKSRYASKFSLGASSNDSLSSWDFDLECSMLKAWRRALTDEEISNLG